MLLSLIIILVCNLFKFGNEIFIAYQKMYLTY